MPLRSITRQTFRRLCDSPAPQLDCLAIQEQLQFVMPTKKREDKQRSGKKIADYYYDHKGRIPPYLLDGRDPKAVMQAFDDCVTMINRTLKELEGELKTKLDSPEQIKSTIHKTKDLKKICGILTRRCLTFTVTH